MIRYRLAQSNTWVYSIQKTLPDGDRFMDRNKCARECKLELQAWIMKMDPTREEVPEVGMSGFYDYRNLMWRIDASWLSSRKLHKEGE